jgi:lipopolysaccharide heptosyltransferase II
VKIPSKILIFRQSSLGDVILTLPVLDSLKERFPECHIDYLTKTAFAPIVQFHPAISTVYTFDGEHPFSGIISDLRSQKYDTLIDLQVNLRSLAIRAGLFPIHVLRYKKRRWAREMVVRRAGSKLAVDHTVAAYLAALGPLGINAELAPPVMKLPTEAHRFADEFLIGLGQSPKLIAFCPGARHYEKRWPAASFRAVAEMMLKDPSLGIIVFSANDDRFEPNLGIDHSKLLTAKNLGLLEAGALLSRCQAALTNDSGLMHLANAVGTPVLAIFGPTNPRLGFAPTLAGSKIICDDVACSPCSVHGQRPCRMSEKYCFEKITPQRVVSELGALL